MLTAIGPTTHHEHAPFQPSPPADHPAACRGPAPRLVPPPLLLLVGVTVYGVIGYRVVEGWSLLTRST